MYIRCLGFFLLCLFGCGEADGRRNSYPSRVRQLIEVKPIADTRFRATITLKHRTGETWTIVEQDMPAVVGRNGIIRKEDKKEGDGHTPMGFYPIQLAFGTDVLSDCKLSFRHITDEDYWVDDAESPDYNRWVVGKPSAKSYEKMKIDLYKFGAVIEYNTNPVQAGKGSAIFFHLWPAANRPTAGCVATSEENVIKVLRWLDPEMQPHIVILE